MSLNTHWRSAGIISDTQNKKYLLFWPIFGLKKRIGTGSETQMLQVSNVKASDGQENSLERCRGLTRHTETGIFAFLADLGSKKCKL